MTFLLGPWAKLIGGAVALAGLWWGWHQLTGHYIDAGRAQLQPALTQAEADRDSARGQVKILNEVRAAYEPKLNKIAELAGDVRRLSAGVSVCNSLAAFPPTAGAAPGPDAAPAGEQPQPAEAVLQQLAADFAERADRTAEQLNALIDWLERTRGE